ncbi:MAG: acetylornithine/succinylornithine family transaminase [Candidatus Neomarinimicrobiota bacterium]|nr:acetylornithine/succinylornithine family transaminase [Candidatus Neomarinimicrobiota bacterium]
MNQWINLEERRGSGAYGGWPITLVRGKGTRVWDSSGSEYLDFATGIGVASIGHSNPLLQQVVSHQAGLLMTAHNGYYCNDVRAQFLNELARIAPLGLERVFLCNSGTEAIEGAIKLARSHSGRTQIVAAMRSFHGRTLGSLSATWNKAFREPFEPLVPDFAHVPFGNKEALANAMTEETAAVILEPIQGEGGVYPAPEGYLWEARQLCDQWGAMLILDEVQTGGGRTGRWFACEHYGVFPDVLTVAKGLGGGVPIGAVIMRDNISFEKKQHGSTFGGNPLSCRAALAVIQFIEENDLLSNAEEVGTFFLDGLSKLADEKREMIREARGLGLMLALQLKRSAGPVLAKLREMGVLALTAGRTNIRFLPPLTVTKGEVNRVLNLISDALR